MAAGCSLFALACGGMGTAFCPPGATAGSAGAGE